MTRILLVVLAVPVVAAVAVLVAIARLARQLERDGVMPGTAPDDSEVVGMPTTWDRDDRTCFSNSWSLAPGWNRTEAVMTGYGCPCGNRVPCEAHPLTIYN